MNKSKNLTTLFVLVVSLVCAIWVNQFEPRQWVETQHRYETKLNQQNQLVYTIGGQEQLVEKPVPYKQSSINQQSLDGLDGQSPQQPI